ncbi:MAG: hypothetical protein IPP25_11255 [Saprospiraceae bacterium]|nr:hypothetical protein [Candidatus Opimibacter skivensis]
MALGSAVLWAIIWIGIKSAENNGFTTTILWASIGRGLFMGISWALIMKWMSGDPYKHVRLKLESEETVVKEGGANLMTGNKERVANSPSRINGSCLKDNDMIQGISSSLLNLTKSKTSVFINHGSC